MNPRVQGSSILLVEAILVVIGILRVDGGESKGGKPSLWAPHRWPRSACLLVAAADAAPRIAFRGLDRGLRRRRAWRMLLHHRAHAAHR
jgi:hypothetical protein